jgi:hypothetical protein
MRPGHDPTLENKGVRTKRGGAALVIGTCLLLLELSSARAAPKAALRIPLVVRVARCQGKLVRDTSWVNAHLLAASKLFGEQRVQLAPSITTFRPSGCSLLERTERHSLARFAEDGVVNVLVVERVRDLDLPSYDLMGVHWRGPKAGAYAGRRWIYLTARARPPVLAHELGHFFGLTHDRKGGNLMTPGPSAPIWRDRGKRRPKAFQPRFSPAQGRALRRGVADWTTANDKRKQDTRGR